MSVTIEFPVNGVNGGLGDRLLGMANAILLAKALHLSFWVKWDAPNVSQVFQIVHNFYFSPGKTRPFSVILSCIDQLYKYEQILSSENIPDLWADRNILVHWNMPVAKFLYANPFVLAKKTIQAGNFETDLEKVFQTLFTQELVPLVRPIPISEPYIGIQIRTGDVSMGFLQGHDLRVSQLEPLLDSLAQFCEQKTNIVYVTSDHPDAVRLLRQRLPNLQFVNPPPNSRVHLEKSRVSLTDLVQDFLTLKGASQLLVSHFSNYGKLAAWCSSPETPIFSFRSQAPFTPSPVSRAVLIQSGIPPKRLLGSVPWVKRGLVNKPHRRRLLHPSVLMNKKKP